MGMSGEEASMKKIGSDKVYAKDYRAQWGGSPKPGTQAWIRREIARTEVA